jgi:hypothetical protein
VGNKVILQVTFVEALDQLMPGFDPEISKLAQRVLINPRNIDYHTGVFASKVTTSVTSPINFCRVDIWNCHTHVKINILSV